MTTLRVMLDALAVSPHGGMSRYAGELTRALLVTAPSGVDIVGVVPSSPQPDYDRILEKLPGLAGLEKSALAPRELAAAWRAGLARSTGAGMFHSMSMLAPLTAHDRVHRPTDQIVVTVHDATAWTHPHLLAPRARSFAQAMGRRIEKHADAVVVSGHAIADDLARHLDLGDRLRVVPGAPTGSLVPDDAAAQRERLELPERYLLTVAGADPRKNLAALLDALRELDDETSLVVVADSADAVGELVRAADVERRVRVLSGLSDAELGTVYHFAHAYVQPSIAQGSALAVIEALGFGLPVVHTDLPALEEATADAALIVPLDGDGFPTRLAEALRSVDGTLEERLSVASGDRARAFDWRDSAARVWQLHADL